ncbi:regulatory protein RecX [Cellvibrio japonicus]|nr:regulatory protein RecX [Cellvibrio japonicus]QEI12664.1 regulatory protein RecX [Cellvibrio japonicus]QEI16238.1 regulatory protein RecX [Cellvibrio japonicus]QEI19816.1 regulatory protein RecX [Cellvibrio japonicus]
MAAMDLLAMREHSQQELLDKLRRKYPGEAASEYAYQEVQRLVEEGLQSDSRFAEAFAVMRYRQGKGPLLIAQELKARGITSDVIADTLSGHTFNWADSACQQRQKRFGAAFPSEAKERARQQRFLAMRGFGNVHIRTALSTQDCDDFL